MDNININAETINDLIEINNDRIVGYETAIKDLQDGDSDLKTLFTQMIQQSRAHNEALKAHVVAMGEKVEEGTTVRGKLHRAWMDIKSVITGGSRQAVLDSAERGEDANQAVYKKALAEKELSPDLHQLIADQKAELRQSHNEVKRLRDAGKA